MRASHSVATAVLGLCILCPSVEAALHAHWKLAGNLNDELGNFPGTSIGAVASFTGLDQVSGCNSPEPSQSAITMPTRSSTSYVTMDGGAFTGLTDFTWSMWWKPTHLTGLGGDALCLWSVGRSGKANMFTFFYRSAEPDFVLWWNDNLCTHTPNGNIPTLNVWTHLAVTRSGSTMKIYMDGVELPAGGSSSQSCGSTNFGTIPSNGFYLGNDQDTLAAGFATTNTGLGLYADMRLYDSAMTDVADIERLATPAKCRGRREDNLIFHYKLNDMNGQDSSGNGFHGSGSKGTALAVGGALGTCSSSLLMSASVDSWIQLNGDPLHALDIFTLSIWIKDTAVGGSRNLISYGAFGSLTSGIQAENDLYMRFQTAGPFEILNALHGTEYKSTTNAYTQDTLVHSVVVYDQLQVHVYVNGVLSKTTIRENTRPLGADANSFYLGQDQDATGAASFDATQAFVGQAADFRAYKGAFTPAQVADLFALGACGESATPSLSKGTITTSNSISATTSPSTTDTDSPTVTPPETHSGTESDSRTASSSATLTDTVTPAPTATPSATTTVTPPETATMTSTATVTPPPTATTTDTLSRSDTPSLSSTATSTVSESATVTFTTSGSATSTWSTTQSLSETESVSEEVYCGGHSQDYCSTLKDCQTTDDGSCYYHTCNMLNESIPLCRKHGCAYNKWTFCTKPPECKDILKIEECQQLLACRWTGEGAAAQCIRDRTPCKDQEVLNDCSLASCSWNVKAAPYKCFKPILAPSLCRLVEAEPVCLQQKCFWMSGGYCESWAVTCEELLPSPSNCPFLPLCVYSGTLKKCESIAGIDFTTLGYVKIVAHKVSAVEFPDATFNLDLVGTPLDPDVHSLFMVNANSSGCSAPLDSTLSTFSISTYDYGLKATRVKTTAAIGGEFAFCLKESATKIHGPYGNITIKISPPQIDSTSTVPTTPFVDAPFDVTVTGKFLDPNRAVFAWANGTSANNSGCPDPKSVIWETVLRGDGSTAYARSVLQSGEYTLCYMNRGGVPALSPETTKVSGVPPWLNATRLAEVALTLPKIEGLSIMEYNARNCKSLQLLNKTGGLFIHPITWPFQVGDGSSPYTGAETCIMTTLPKYVQGYDDPTDQVMQVDMFYASMNLGDSVRVFRSGTVDSPASCGFYNQRFAKCIGTSCGWDSTTQTCAASVTLNGCPVSIPGYSLERVVTYESFFDASEKFSVATPTNEGFIFVFCSPGLNPDGLGTSMKYSVTGTYCPNDCKDSTGSQNGRCMMAEPDDWVCKCNDGFTGRDCSRPAMCRGVGPAAGEIRGAEGVEVIDMERDSCGMILKADPTGTTMDRMARYGLGMRIYGLEMAANSTDCALYYITIRHTDHQGDVLHTLCPNELALAGTGEVIRFAIEDGVSVYMEYRGVPGDKFSVAYTAVSLVCPGEAGVSGVPTAARECDGRGTCEKIDYANTKKTLEPFLYTCTCRSPWAATFIGETCDTCAFGFMVDSFPTCEPATICANNCSNNGYCEQGVGCLCGSGYYGLDCQLLDDGERSGALKPLLLHRLPLNVHDAGNTVSSGNYDRTITMCALPGSRRPCRVDGRSRGKISKQQSNTGASGVIASGLSNRRQRSATENATFNSSSTEDLGLNMNALATRGSYPDFVRTDNVSLSDMDVAGGFTIMCWGRFSAKSNGFLFAKVDAAFLPDGRSPPLERAKDDILDRNIPEADLLSANMPDSLVTHIALYIDGESKQVSFLVSDTNRRAAAESKEDWLYVRHFRLGDSQGLFFDGSWRLFALRVYQKDTRMEAQIFIDGVSIIGDPNYVQCLPWMPTRQYRAQHNVANLTVGQTMNGSSILWGYRLKASLDELQVYSSALSAASIIRVAGIEAVSAITRVILIVLMTGCSLVIFLHLVMVVVVIVKRRRAAKAKEEAEKKEDEEDKEDEEKEGEDDKKDTNPAKTPDAIAVDYSPGEAPLDANPMANRPTEQSDNAQLSPMASPKANTTAVTVDPDEKEEDGDAPKKEDQEAAAEEDEESSEDESSNDEEEEVAAPPNDGREQGGITDLSEEKETRGPSDAAMESQIDKMDPNVGRYLSPKERRKHHLALLVKIQDLKDQAHSRKEKGAAAKATKGSGGDATESTSGNPAADFSNVATGSATSWQILSELNSGMELPALWAASFGKVAHFLMVDFSALFAAIHAPIFIFVMSLAMLLFLVLMLILCVHKTKSKRALVRELEQVAEDRQHCLDEEEEYEPKKPKVFKIALLVGTLISIMYMPVVNQALAVVFCHPSLLCIYDCYNDATHQTLVLIGSAALLIVGFGTPVLFLIAVKQAVTQYHTYLGKFEGNLQAKHWGDFVDNVDSPFAGSYGSMHHGAVYFTPLTYVYKAAMSAALVGLDSESPEQLIACIVLQLVYSTGSMFAQSFRSAFVNGAIALAQLYITIILLLRSIQLLEPEASEVGLAMVILSSVILLCQIILISYTIKKLVMNVIRAKQEDNARKARHEELHPEDDDLEPGEGEESEAKQQRDDGIAAQSNNDDQPGDQGNQSRGSAALDLDGGDARKGGVEKSVADSFEEVKSGEKEKGGREGNDGN